MLSKVARNALVVWESHGSRNIEASFNTKKEGITMNVIQFYAPINDSDDDIKDQFYGRLQSVIAKCPRNDLSILIDLNAIVGMDNTGYEDIIGRHGLGERNENRKRFANLFNTAFLRDPDKLNEFKVALNNRFQALQDLLKEEETTMEDNCKDIKEALTSTCQEVLGLKKHHHKEWISTETLDRIKERRNRKTAINNSRTRAEEVQAQAEPAPMNPPEIEAVHTDLPIDVNPPTTEEIRMAIRQIKNGKAAGPDNIPTEALKSDIDVTTNMLYLLFKKIWEEKQVSMDWKERRLIKISRKGNLSKYCIMKTLTPEGKLGIQWRAQHQLDDLYFADDLALLSHTHERMQINTPSLAAVSASQGENPGPKIQYGAHQSNHSWWRNSGRCRILHIPGKHHR
ncbi:unnamed protein product [Schistosoma curassoni]|uniref:Reverse transcriptase domain-containing protein n=1 Tax=Schistosoma curassoni TaxID=6186 RepID=A0A183K7P2_9TREM|nr:unnamed protein product [Schistosoma curassoni]